MNKNQTNRSYSSARVILFEDSALSVLASLLSILLVRWVSEPMYGYSTTVLIWISASLAGTLLGFFLFKSHKVIRRHASVCSLARIVGAVLVKFTLLVIVLLIGLIKLPNPSCYFLVVLADLLLTAGSLLYIRMSARIFSESGGG